VNEYTYSVEVCGMSTCRKRKYTPFLWYRGFYDTAVFILSVPMHCSATRRFFYLYIHKHNGLKWNVNKRTTFLKKIADELWQLWFNYWTFYKAWYQDKIKMSAISKEKIKIRVLTKNQDIHQLLKSTKTQHKQSTIQ
jgi:hypothetical protein